MQHYKVKTRLLDWMEDALNALYMAINGAFVEMPSYYEFEGKCELPV